MAVGSINDLICNTSQKLVACPHRIGVKMAKKHSMSPELFYISFFGVVFQNVWSLRMNLPIPSMYGIFTYIWLNLMVNAGKYTIHIYIVWYGLYEIHVVSPQDKWWRGSASIRATQTLADHWWALPMPVKAVVPKSVVPKVGFPRSEHWSVSELTNPESFLDGEIIIRNLEGLHTHTCF